MVRVRKFPTPFQVVLASAMALLLCFWLAPVASAADITVTTTADNTVAGDGQCSLREAVNNANANTDTTAGDCTAGTYLPTDRIYLSAGLYKLQPGFDDTNQKGDLDVLSAGGGLRFVGAGAAATTISGPDYVVGTDRIFDLGVDGPAGILIEFSGLTLSGGHAPQGGGAMYINGIFVLIEDSVIADCEATFAGGTSNNGNGGAIYMDGGSLTMLRTEMLRNTARAGVIHDVSGGAIYATNGSTISIEESRLFGNVTRVPDTGSDRTSAGAIYFSGNSLTIRNSEIISNGVGAIFSEGKGFGGAIYFAGSKLLVEESTVAQNTAGEVAGALYSDGTLVEIVRSSFYSNSVPTGYGGAIVNWATMLITNTTFSGNVALMTAGGISNSSSGTLEIYDSTITNNTCATAGGFAGGACGLYNWGIVTRVKNSIIAGNHDLGAGRMLTPDASGTFTTLGHNLIGDGTGAGGFFNGLNDDLVGTAVAPLDARLEALADYGGATLSHLPLWSSPAIDSGANAGCPAVDQRGVSRPQNGTCDRGAVEFGRPYFLPLLMRE